MIGVVDLPWFIAFFAAGTVVLGFNSFKDWRANISYPVFDIVMIVFVLATAFVYGAIVPTVLTATFMLIGLYAIAHYGAVGMGDVFVLAWSTIGVGMWFGVLGVIIYLLAVWIGHQSMILVNRHFKKWSGELPLLPAVCVGFVIANILLYMLGA